eukprot:TRINITY_DN762_c0_g1_i12.p1 TRINITY_DN762_c0_g1~~TRINITY_DN762_c0_g1_i12.p1  ORF type:complete len:415 (-),score=164.92 TRINITY_DN762_c0_g1_i12:52-1296(-)
MVAHTDELSEAAEFIHLSDREDESSDEELGSDDDIMEIAGEEEESEADIVEIDSDDQDDASELDNSVVEIKTESDNEASADKSDKQAESNGTVVDEKDDHEKDGSEKDDSENVEDSGGEEEDSGGIEEQEENEGSEDDNQEGEEEGDQSENEDDISSESEDDIGADDESEEGAESGAENNDDLDDTLKEGNTGWADAMSKVLRIGKNSKKPVSILSKAKKDNVNKASDNNDSKAKQKDNESSDEGEEKDGDESSEAESSDNEEHVPVSVQRAKKREIDSVGRVRPDITKRAQEKALTKIATKGVVQLFNAVREQQRGLKQKLKEAGSASQRDKVYKNIDKEGFLAVLDGKKRPLSGANKVKLDDSKKPKLEPKVELKEELENDDEEEAPAWSALKENFMLGAKMKDWDKEEVES